jgi:hypothetical protein
MKIVTVAVSIGADHGLKNFRHGESKGAKFRAGKGALAGGLRQRKRAAREVSHAAPS